MEVSDVCDSRRSKCREDLSRKSPRSDISFPSPAVENAMSEALLLESIARGNQRAFDELYRRYYPRLIGFLAKRIPPSHSADEIIDDTLLVVWQHANEFHYGSEVSTWIFGIAYRVALRSLRKDRLWLRATAADETTDPVVDPARAD